MEHRQDVVQQRTTLAASPKRCAPDPPQTPDDTVVRRTKPKAPPPPPQRDSSLPKLEEIQAILPTPETPNDRKHKDSCTSPVKSPVIRGVGFRETLAPSVASDLIEKVRVNTNLSYEKSKVAVVTVLSHVGEVMPDITEDLQKILLAVVHVQVSLLQYNVSFRYSSNRFSFSYF